MLLCTMINRNDFFIASRLASSASGKGVMVRIASVSVAISVAVMLIALSVVGGFKREIESKIIGFGASYQLIDVSSTSSVESVPIVANEKMQRRLQSLDGVTAVYPYATKGGIIRSEQALAGVMLKGVGPDYDSTFFKKHLIEGTLPRIVDTMRTKDILISSALANTLNMGVGDRLEMMFIETDGGMGTRRDRFKISGIYSTGFRDMDIMMTLTDIRNVQRLNSWGADSVSGYEIMTADLDPTYQQQRKISNVVSAFEQDAQYLSLQGAQSRFPALFDWLATHRVNGMVIITIMFLVALLNCSASLLIILLERTSMIGILKALGMRDRKIEFVFVVRSMFIILRGLLWGNAVALILMWLQSRYHLIALDEATYFISSVPIDFGWWIVWLNVGLLVALGIMMVIPAMLVTSIKPEKSIRYQ